MHYIYTIQPFGKLWLTFYEEVIKKLLLFFSEIYKYIQIQFQSYLCSSLCQYIILQRTHAIYVLLI